MSELDEFFPPPTTLQGVFFQPDAGGLEIDGYLEWDSITDLIEYLAALRRDHNASRTQ